MESSLSHLRAILNSGEELEKSLLAERIGRSGRQLQRLIEILRRDGIEIQIRRAQRRILYSVPEHARKAELHPVTLSQQQLLALAVAARAAEATLDSTPLIADLQSANVEVIAALERAAEAAGTIDLREEAERWYFPDAPEVMIDPDVLSVVRQGMHESRTVEIDYHSASSGRALRRVDPYCFAYRDGSWMLCAWCHRNRAVRTFAVSDIYAAQLLDPETEANAIFTRTADFSPERHFRDTFYAVGGDTQHVQLRVGEKQARSFLRKNHHPKQKVRHHDDGSITVSFDCAGLQEARSFILGWGSGVTVIAPEELRRQVREQALAVAAKYPAEHPDGHSMSTPP